MKTNNSTRVRVFALILGAAFAVMLVVSVWDRNTRSSVAVNATEVTRGTSGETSADPAAMNAIGALMREAAHKPDDLNALLRLTEGLMAAGQWQSAENFAQKAAALEKDDTPDKRAEYLLAIIHHNQGRDEQAAEILERYLSRNENPSARYSLGILYNHFLNEPLKGREHLSRGLESGLGSEALRKAMRDELARPAHEVK